MTKQEAIQAMKEGKKVTHRYFGKGEWMMLKKGSNILILEDGVECFMQEFWEIRHDECWENDYSIYEEAN